MRGKELFNVLILCCCLLILSGSFLPYISVNFPDTNVGWTARTMIQEQLPEMFDAETGNFKATAVDLIASMQTGNKCGIVKWWFIAALFLNLVCVLSLLMERKIKYVIILLLDILQPMIWFGGVFLAFPYGIVKYSGIGMTTFVDETLFGLTRVEEILELRTYLFHGMQIGYWMPFAVAFVSFVLCIAALVYKPKRMPEPCGPEENPGTADYYGQEEDSGSWPKGVQEDIALPGITCVAGPYEGSHAPMEFEEEVVVGNDEDACSLVILSDEISPVHCRVRFDRQRNEYNLLCLSPDGTFLNGTQRMEENMWLPLQRGACIRLGRDENILRLD
ncbi:MAG: FHA domain-containing protein [Candidatus Limivivens sp.]|nr:FHA domain-containing protein [Candidatus Limivivens sp.]